MKEIDKDSLLRHIAKSDLTAVEKRHLEELVSGKHGQWIPCSESMPDPHRFVLFFAHSKFVCYGKYCGMMYEHKTWESGAGIYWDNEVTHWMPLPEPPKEVQHVD